MNYNITDSFTEKSLKGGKTRILFRLSQEDKYNICFDLNTYKVAINGKRYFIRYIDGLPRWIQFKNVWDSDVFQYIQRCLQSISYKCNYREYFGVLLQSGTRISWEEMEDLCTYMDINESDKESVLKQINSNYAKDILYAKLKQKIFEWGFKYVEGKFEEGSPCRGIYYKNISSNEYLVFSTAVFQPKTHVYVLDLWKCEYINEKKIGNENPLSFKRIALNFQTDMHYDLIKEFI